MLNLFDSKISSFNDLHPFKTYNGKANDVKREEKEAMESTTDLRHRKDDKSCFISFSNLLLGLLVGLVFFTYCPLSPTIMFAMQMIKKRAYIVWASVS